MFKDYSDTTAIASMAPAVTFRTVASYVFIEAATSSTNYVQSFLNDRFYDFRGRHLCQDVSIQSLSKSAVVVTSGSKIIY